MLIMEDSAASCRRSFLLGEAQVARATRRCLFGPPDPEQTRELVRQELDRIYQQQQQRWNFDFQREVPLPGRYQWQPVSSSSPQESRTQQRFDRPSPTRPDPTSDATSDFTTTGVIEDHKTSAAEIASVEVCNFANVDQDQKCDALPSANRQLRITEMLKTRKRSLQLSSSDPQGPACKHK